MYIESKTHRIYPGGTLAMGKTANLILGLHSKNAIIPLFR